MKLSKRQATVREVGGIVPNLGRESAAPVRYHAALAWSVCRNHSTLERSETPMNPSLRIPHRPLCATRTATVLLLLVLAQVGLAGELEADESVDSSRLQLRDVFELEWADDPRISPDGSQVVYERSFMDVMNDRSRSTLWILNTDGEAGSHQPLTTGLVNHGSPRWSPDGGRLLYVATDPAAGDGAQMWVRWMDSGRTARLTQLPSSPAGLAWSPDGRSIAFTRFVESKPEP